MLYRLLALTLASSIGPSWAVCSDVGSPACPAVVPPRGEEDGAALLQTKLPESALNFSSSPGSGPLPRERGPVLELIDSLRSSAGRAWRQGHGSEIWDFLLESGSRNLNWEFNPFDARPAELLESPRLHDGEDEVPLTISGGNVSESMDVEEQLQSHSPMDSSPYQRARDTWTHDILGPMQGAKWKRSNEFLGFFKTASMTQWSVFIAVCIGSVLLDMFVIQELRNTMRVHLAAIVFWFGVAGAFNVWIGTDMGRGSALEWCSGYFLEWILGIDNLFVFHMLFHRYKTPRSQIHKALFVGIVGALFLRLVFFMVLSTLLHVFHWIRVPFGLMLVWSGIETAKGDTGDSSTKLEDLPLVWFAKKLLGARFFEGYSKENNMVVYGESGEWKVTMLLVVVCSLEVTDTLFAIDSVSAKLSQIPNQYLAFSSSMVAMFGLRAMFFLVEDLVDMFCLLPYGLCLILVFIGFQLVFAPWIHLTASTVFVLIVSVLVTCIAGSVVWTNLQAQLNDRRAMEADVSVSDQKSKSPNSSR